MTEIHERLREAIATAELFGWTHTKIAKSCGIPQTSLSRFCADEKNDLALKTAAKLLEFFHVELSDFWVEVGAAESPDGRVERPAYVVASGKHLYWNTTIEKFNLGTFAIKDGEVLVDPDSLPQKPDSLPQKPGDH